MQNKKKTLLLLLLNLPLLAMADNRLDSLFIMCRLQDNGDAHITEKRVMYIDEKGSELYIPIGNLDGSQIKDLMVFDEGSKEEYKNIGEWDEDASAEEKTNKCGIITKDDGGVEICWGIGHRGKRTYYTCYTVTSLARSYSDYDGFNYMFVNPGIYPAPRHVVVSISHEQYAMEETNARGWAFGFKGEVEVRNDRVVVESDGPFDDDDYCVVLCRFEKDMMHPALVTDDSFETLKEKAFEGSDYGVKEKSWRERIEDIIAWIVMILGGLGVVGGGIFGIKAIASGYRQEHKLKKKLKENLTWWREPIFGLQKSNSILAGLDYLSGYNTKNLLSAYVLKMLYMGWLKVVDERENQTLAGSPDKDKKMFLAIGEQKADSTLMDSDSRLMPELHNIFVEAAGEDRTLQPKELQNYMKEHEKALVPFVERLQKMTFAHDLNENQMDGAKKLLGFKKFLEEFTLSNERHAYEVKLWKDYLIYATLFGCGDQVRKDMKQINPEFFKMDEITRQLETTDDLLPSFTAAAVAGTKYISNFMERQKAGSEQESRTWGFGGHSSIHGGGGFSGGGHGGGIR